MSASDPEFDPFKIMPPLGRMGLFRLVLNAIKEKNDARAVAAFLTFSVLLVPALVGVVGPAIAGLALLASADVSEFIDSHPYLFAGAIILSASSLLSSLTFFYARERYNQKLLRADLSANFKILQSVSLCAVHSRTKVDYHDRYYVKARKDGVRTFTLTFSWSGDGSLEFRLKNPGFSHKFTRIGPGNRNLLEIDLGRPLKKGVMENIEYEIITDTSNGREQLPYYAVMFTSPKYPWFNTHLIAWISKTAGVVAVYREIFYSPVAVDAASSEPESVGEDGCVRWRVFPRLGWRHSLRWVYEGTMEHN